MTAVAEAAALAREAGSRFVLNAAPAQALPDELLSIVEVLVVNEHEARHLSGAADPAQAAGVLLGATRSVVVTLGASGALVVDGSGSRRVDGVPADVIDTTAAGDTFTGYLAASLAAGDSLDDAAARAVVAGAISVETHRRGAVDPHRRAGGRQGQSGSRPMKASIRVCTSESVGHLDPRAVLTARAQASSYRLHARQHHRALVRRRGSRPGRSRGPGPTCA